MEVSTRGDPASGGAGSCHYLALSGSLYRQCRPQVCGVRASAGVAGIWEQGPLRAAMGLWSLGFVWRLRGLSLDSPPYAQIRS